MRRCNVLLPIIMLLVQASAFAAGSTMKAPTSAMVVSYWGYIALPPVMIVALVVYGLAAAPKQVKPCEIIWS